MKLRMSPRGRGPYITIAACVVLAVCTALGVAVYARQKSASAKADKAEPLQNTHESVPGEINVE